MKLSFYVQTKDVIADTIVNNKNKCSTECSCAK